MNSKIFFLLAFLVCVAAVFAFDPTRVNAIVDKSVAANNNLTRNATEFLMSQPKFDRPCKGIPGCFQFMCNKCCGDCNQGDCVTAMCMLCCG